MKYIKLSLALILVVFAMNISNTLYAETAQDITVGTIIYHINDGNLSGFVWNGKEDADCKCEIILHQFSNCWFEQPVESGTNTVSHIIGSSEVTISGTVVDAQVTVNNNGVQIALDSQTNNIVIPISFVTTDSAWFVDIPAGTIIDFPEFSTDANSNYVVVGVIRN